MAIQVPTGAVGGDDLLQPMQDLLRGLSVLPTQADLDKNPAGMALLGTPQSVSIIESGATALSKGYAVVITALGGGAAVASLVTGFWKGEATGVRIALTAGTALFLAAAVIAVAVIVASDVRGRAAGAVSQYNVRSQVAVSLLEVSFAARRDTAAGSTRAAGVGSALWSLAVAGWPVEVLRKGTSIIGTLSGVRADADGKVQVQITRRNDGVREWCYPDELELRENTFDQTGR
jgi:hypothetical protein